MWIWKCAPHPSHTMRSNEAIHPLLLILVWDFFHKAQWCALLFLSHYRYHNYNIHVSYCYAKNEPRFNKKGKRKTKQKRRQFNSSYILYLIVRLYGIARLILFHLKKKTQTHTHTHTHIHARINAQTAIVLHFSFFAFAVSFSFSKYGRFLSMAHVAFSLQDSLRP